MKKYSTTIIAKIDNEFISQWKSLWKRSDNASVYNSLSPEAPGLFDCIADAGCIVKKIPATTSSQEDSTLVFNFMSIPFESRYLCIIFIFLC